MTMHTDGRLMTSVHYPQEWAAVVLLSMIIFVASYATGLGNVPWQQGELFSLEGQLTFLRSISFSSSFTHQ